MRFPILGGPSAARTTPRAYRPVPLVSSLVVSLAGHMLYWASPVQAQSLLQQLFGLSPSPQVTQAARPIAPRQPLGGMPIRLGSGGDSYRPREPRSSGPPVGSGSYTTVCVRMCDGFYFPISHRVGRSRFYNDAEACRSRCGQSEARLFYHSSGTDMKSAVDLTGRAYARLPVAFMHRKRLVEGCTCRPEPWSEAALIRHEGYAIAEGRAGPGGPRMAGTLAIVAGRYSDKPLNSATPPTTSAVTQDAPASGSQMQEEEAMTPPSVMEEPAVARQAEDGAVPSIRGGVGALVQPRRKRIAGGTIAARTTPTRKPALTRTSPYAPRPPAGVSLASTGKLVWPGDSPVRTR